MTLILFFFFSMSSFLALPKTLLYRFTQMLLALLVRACACVRDLNIFNYIYLFFFLAKIKKKMYVFALWVWFTILIGSRE